MTIRHTPKTPPRDNVCRSVPFTFTRDGGMDGEDGCENDGLSFEGYGAIFNSLTRIDSWEGTFDEQIAPGAFRKSIRERTPKFQFDHGRSNFGSLPPGVIEEILEDDKGLYVRARMSASEYWEPLRDAIATGAVDGMSFRFSVIREEWRDEQGKIVKPEDVEQALWDGSRGILLRTLKEVKVDEVGPVVWPAYADTTASLRSKSIDIGRLFDGDPEQRRLFAEAALRFSAASQTPERGQSDDEPQDTPQGAVEHSDEDSGTPQSTSPDEAGEHAHESETDTPTADRAAQARREADERLFADAYDFVRLARESTPPLKGVIK